MLIPDIQLQLPYPGWQSRHHIQMGPKQSLLPNSTETSSPTHVWEALPRTVPRGASSQGPGHQVMGRWDLSGDDRPWGKAPGECACTGVRQDTPESEKISESKDRYFRKDRLRINWKYSKKYFLPEKEPFLTPAISPPSSSGHPQAAGVFRGVSRKWKTCCLMLRVNTAPSCVPTTHTGRTSPCGTDSPLCPLSQEGCRTVNSHTEPNNDFPTFSLTSHSPPGEASCTSQKGAPQLTRHPIHCLFSWHGWTRGLKSRHYWVWALQQKRTQDVNIRTLSIQNGDKNLVLLRKPVSYCGLYAVEGWLVKKSQKRGPISLAPLLGDHSSPADTSSH